MAVAPATRRASDRQRPCHTPLALAPRRLYTSPMRNPTSACPHLPDAARGTSQRSRNCPESGPPYPQNGSCRTRRIVSAADRFEADSFPKKEKLGGGTNPRSSPRPQGPSPRRACLGGPTPPRWPAARTRAAPTLRRPGTPTPHKADAARGVSRQRTINAQSHAEATGSLHQANNQPFLYLPGSEGAKNRTDYPPNYNNQTARCRQRPPAPPSDRCDAVALRCATMHQATPTRHRQPLERHEDPCTTVIPAPTRRGGPAPPPPTKPSRSDRQRPGV